jgi:hypothetical protein
MLLEQTKHLSFWINRTRNSGKRLSTSIFPGPFSVRQFDASYGQGPCVEFKDALYVFDAGVLSAFDLKTGNVRWRLPSIGITGLFFDDQGMIMSIRRPAVRIK